MEAGGAVVTYNFQVEKPGSNPGSGGEQIPLMNSNVGHLVVKLEAKPLDLLIMK